MSMIWLYVFMLDFLILFLCDPDLQCMSGLRSSLIFKAPHFFVCSTSGILCVLSGIPKFEMLIFNERDEGGFGQALSGSEL